MSTPLPGKQRDLSVFFIAAALICIVAVALIAVFYWNKPALDFPDHQADPPENAVPGPVTRVPEEPFWPEPPVIARPPYVKGIYVNLLALDEEKLSGLIDLVKGTELNAMVVDLKDDRGHLTYGRSMVPWAREAGAPNPLLKNPVEFVRLLSANGIYPIARIVAFKDNLMAAYRPDLAILNSNGEPWRDGGGQYWLDPYNKEAWKYIVALAREAAEIGFREIQFDYLRFPSDGNLRDIVYPHRDDTPQNMVFPSFLRYARASLEEYGVEVSVDVFGLVTSDPTGMGIGQHLESMAGEVDLICPMIYPSHYGSGNFGLADPEAAPYEIVYRSIADAQQRLQEAGLSTSLRPWLQSFSIRHVYRAGEIRAQIEAAEKMNVHEFLLWNNGNYYNRDALRAPGKE